MPHDLRNQCLGAIARRGGAWLLCVATLAVAAIVGFRSVAAWAHPAFEARLQARKSSALNVEVGAVVGSLALAEGLVVRQDFDAIEDGLCGVRLRAVTWHAVPDASTCEWTLLEHAPDGASKAMIRRGSFAADTARDWESLTLSFDPINDSFSARYTLVIRAGPESPAHPVGLPLYAPRGVYQHGVRVGRRQTEVISQSGRKPTIPTPSTLDLQPVYIDERG